MEKVLERVAVPRPIIRHRLGIERRAEREVGGDRATEHVVHLSRGCSSNSVGRHPSRPPGVAPSGRGLKQVCHAANVRGGEWKRAQRPAIVRLAEAPVVVHCAQAAYATRLRNSSWTQGAATGLPLVWQADVPLEQEALDRLLEVV